MNRLIEQKFTSTYFSTLNYLYSSNMKEQISKSSIKRETFYIKHNIRMCLTGRMERFYYTFLQSYLTKEVFIFQKI